MKTAFVLFAVVVAAYAAPDPQKRFLFKEIGHAIHHIGDTIGDTFTDVWHHTENEFNKLTHGLNVNLDNVVDHLIPLINSGMTQQGCHLACVKGAAVVLGPAAPLAGAVCSPACQAALAKLQKLAG